MKSVPWVKTLRPAVSKNFQSYLAGLPRPRFIRVTNRSTREVPCPSPLNYSLWRGLANHRVNQSWSTGGTVMSPLLKSILCIRFLRFFLKFYTCRFLEHEIEISRA